MKIFTGKEMQANIAEAEQAQWLEEERAIELMALMRDENYQRID